jgi:hypothetical protein
MEVSRPFSASARDAVLFHAAFAVLAVVVLAAGPGSVGWRMFLLVVAYNLALPTVGLWRGHARWTRLWAFLLPLSVVQIIPDGFLVTVLNTLDFPVRSGPMVGPIPAAMGGMWVVPLWVALFTGREAVARGWSGVWAAALVGGLLLVSAEVIVSMVPFWSAVPGLHTLGPVPVYVIIPEFLLGAAAYVAENRTRGEARTARVIAAATVSVFYLGMLASSYYLFERIVP